MIALTLAVFAQLTMTVSADAAEYTFDAFECGGVRGSGGVDELDNFYLPCGVIDGAARPHIRVYDANGILRRTVEIDFDDRDKAQVTDVAPSPDGSHIYVIRRRVWRLNRQGDGSYALDRTWKLAPFPYPAWDGEYEARGEFVATDALGFVYVSSGSWSSSPNTVVKYSADGRFVTNFGDVVEKSWELGEFWWLFAGLAVTRDGRSVYTAEVGNNRIQRFERQVDGSYRSTLSFGNTLADDNPATADDEARNGICDTPGKLAAPYDLALDNAGNVYVVNTSCFYKDRSFEAVKFTADGQWLATLKPTSKLRKKVHGIGVDEAGNVYLAQADRVLRPSASPTPVPFSNQGGPGAGPVVASGRWPLLIAAALSLVFLLLAARSLLLGFTVFTLLSFFPGVPEGSPGRMKAAGLGLAVGWCLSVARSDRCRLVWRDHPRVAWSAALLCVWAMASTLWAVDPYDSFSASTKLALGCALAGVVFSTVPDRRTLRRVILAFVVGATLTTVWGLVFFPGARSATAAVVNVDRLTGGMADPNDLAAVILPAMGLAFFGFTTAGTRTRRLTLAACLAVLVLGLILTQSRGAFVGAVVMLFFAAVAGGPIRARAAMLAAVILTAGLGYYFVLAPQTSVDRVLGTVQSDAEGRTPDGAGRLPLWKLAWKQTRDRPVLGVGAGNFRSAAPSYLARTPPRDRPSDLTVVHNTGLELQAELGVVGLFLFAGVVLGAIGVGWTTVRRASRSRQWEDEVMARGILAAIAGLLGADLFRSGEYDIHLWLLLGLAVASSAVVESPVRTGRPIVATA